ncbi:hypothetical protein BAL199_14632 [alpha proteobacterium BAL199]|nr:hypothetical protein BAL199_14632 [alpha proteobacterium BAL199]
MTYYVFTDRENLIRCLPENAVGAEVGVFAGEFAASILEGARPSELHLIDAWRFVGYNWRDLPPQVPETQHAAFVRYLKAAEPAWQSQDPSDGLAMLYERVQSRFAEDARVRIVRGLSSTILAGYPDGFFDFLYVDADHDYHSVLSDLWAARRTLRPGGLILGHDFDMDRRHQWSNHNVIEAVMSFCKNSGFRLIALTGDLGSTFVLGEYPDSDSSAAFLTRLIALRAPIVDIPQEIAWNYRRQLVRGENGRAIAIPSFRS